MSLAPARNIPRLVIAGPASNVGKTTVTAGLIASLRQRGLVVQPFKCGPDYIDPGYHERAAGRTCRNLDSWMLDDDALLEGFARACRGADIAVIEGVMGLFDGCDWEDERGSTAQIAKLLRAPVLLVVDIAAAARSAAVAVLGCQHFDSHVPLRGVVLNLAGSEAHANGCARAITARTGLPVLGWLPRDDRLRVPERHLGLMPSGEQGNTDALIAELAAQVTKRFDIAALYDVARDTDPLPPPGKPVESAEAAIAQSSMERDGRRVRRPVVAVARDAAFCFYYPENLELLQAAGADIEFFSPLGAEAPCAQAGGVYLGGGYPELHGRALSANTGLWRALRELQSRGAPIYAECGGFMALTEGSVDQDGRLWQMAGLVPGVVRMSNRLAALGYRHATALQPNLLVDGGESLRGHEFRYSGWECDVPAIERAAWHVRGTHDASPTESIGYVSGNLLASYLHIHFGQRRQLAARFVQRLRPPDCR